jgi:hypothetical protein
MFFWPKDEEIPTNQDKNPFCRVAVFNFSPGALQQKAFARLLKYEKFLYAVISLGVST